MTTPQAARRPLPATVAAALLAALGLLAALALVTVSPARAAGDHPYAKYAETFRGDGTLKQGCNNYRYRYKLTPPKDADTWALETFLTDRRGKTIASSGILDGADPKKGTDRFRFCRENTVPGRFKLRGKFTYKVGFDTFDGWIDPTYFKLTTR